MESVTKDRIEELIVSNSLVRMVRDGETTFEKEVDKLKEGFLNLEKRLGSWRHTKETKRAAEEYAFKFNSLFSLMDHLYSHSSFSNLSSANVNEFIGDKKKSHRNRKWGVATVAVYSAWLPLAMIFVPVIGLPILTGVMCGVSNVFWQQAWGFGKEGHDVKLARKNVAEGFERAKKMAAELDDGVHKAYLEHYYRKSAEEAKLVKYDTMTAALFKEAFQKLDEAKQKGMIEKLLGMENNPQLDPWLGEHYPKLVDFAGRERYIG